MLGETIAIYAITDDLLKAIGHRSVALASLVAIIRALRSISKNTD